MNERELKKSLKDPEKFKLSVKTSDDLVNLANKFYQHSDTLIQIVLNNPKEFQRLVINRDLRYLAEHFPKYADIFNQPSIEEANAARKEYLRAFSTQEIHKNVEGLLQEGKLMPAIVEIISAYTGNPEVHDEITSQQAAHSYDFFQKKKSTNEKGVDKGEEESI